jgi:ferredoxin-NADP reductase
MAYQFHKGIITKVLDATPNVKRFFIRIPELERYEFNAGQFTLLDLPIDSKIKTRAYSIASAPNDSNEIELVIVLKDGGLGTMYLFGEAGVGTGLSVSQPVGKFNLPRPERFEEPLVFICTGTGIAPFRSMIHDIIQSGIEYSSIHLIKGSRKPHDILYHDEMTELSKEKNNIHFIPVLSRAEDHEWDGHTGYVHDVYPAIVNKHESKGLYYICGWKEMIMQTRKNLMDLGVPKDKIRFELYD